jgi:hypothetical protein
MHAAGRVVRDYTSEEHLAIRPLFNSLNLAQLETHGLPFHRHEVANRQLSSPPMVYLPRPRATDEIGYGLNEHFYSG